jgi:hypothetical protein
MKKNRIMLILLSVLVFVLGIHYLKSECQYDNSCGQSQWNSGYIIITVPGTKCQIEVLYDVRVCPDSNVQYRFHTVVVYGDSCDYVKNGIWPNGYQGTPNYRYLHEIFNYAADTLAYNWIYDDYYHDSLLVAKNKLPATELYKYDCNDSIHPNNIHTKFTNYYYSCYSICTAYDEPTGFDSVWVTRNPCTYQSCCAITERWCLNTDVTPHKWIKIIEDVYRDPADSIACINSQPIENKCVARDHVLIFPCFPACADPNP